jgi:hypothetical protein
MTTYSTQAPTAPVSAVKVATGTAAAAVAAVAVNAGVAAVALGLGASPAFLPLQFAPFAALTVLGTIAGALGWSIVRRRAARPAQVLSRLVPLVVLASFVPDVAALVTGIFVGTSALAVGALMVMHVVVTTAAVVAFRLVLPLPAETPAR